ncbi:MAG TPA: 8-amino-7-oxononanoate synthase [Polyangiales bacterium]|nr:8-amino-7-oxononanoate synthase [Polyangiales bacterium]
MDFRQRVREELGAIEARGLRRRARRVEGPQGPRLWVDGRYVIGLCSNNYLGLARHPALLSAMRDALDNEGLGSGASRQISGSMRAHRQAEAALAQYVGQPASVLFSSGYACNVGVIQGLVERGDIVFSDRLNHASLIDGARLSRAEVVIYDHADPADLEQKLRAHRARGRTALVVTESMFSMDGDVPAIAELARLAREHEAGFVVDEAHALGVLGSGGRGVCHSLGIVPDVLIGTLGKAFGSEGAFASGSDAVVDLLRQRSRSYVFSTAPAAPIAAVAVAAVKLVSEAEGLRETLRRHGKRLREGLRDLGYDVLRGEGPIIPVMVGEPGPTMELSRRLFEQGVFVHGVRPPTVPDGTGRLRVVPMASHTTEDIEDALQAFAEVAR